MKKLLILLFISLAVAGAAYHWQDRLGVFFSKTNLESIALRSFNGVDLLPPPLRGSTDGGGTALTHDGVVVFTNKARSQYQLDALLPNSILDQVAKKKLQDMFDQQYFEHVSPQGKGPADLAEEVDYQYIIVGENLALGNFENDEALIQAWMDSPGHRANILNTHYQEIGVAVGQGQFEGKVVWLAVQSFGTPITICPKPSGELQQHIDSLDMAVDTMQAELDAKKQELDTLKKDENYAEYNRQAATYNKLVDQLNVLIKDLKQLTAEYNRQVNSFNQCVKGNS